MCGSNYEFGLPANVKDRLLLLVGKEIPLIQNASEAFSSCLSLIDRLKDASHEIITLYYGQDVSEEEAAALAQQVAEKYPDCDVDFHNGGQPIYYYIVSLE